MRVLFKKSLLLITTITACAFLLWGCSGTDSKEEADNTTKTEAEDTEKSEETDTVETSGETAGSKTEIVPLESGAEPSEEQVVFSKTSGVYSEEFLLEISCPDSTEIYFTLDGTDPRTSSTRQLYTEAINIQDRSQDENYFSAVEPTLFDAANIELNKTKDDFISTLSAPTKENVDKCNVVRAIGRDSNGNLTATTTATYFVGPISDHIQGIEESCKVAGTSLAIISININYEDLFDSTTGIYVKGNIFQKALEDYLASGETLKKDTARNLDANYKQRGNEWERNIHMELFESDGTTTTSALSQDCGVRIQGNYSRSDLQKGFRLYAREEYGEKNFSYPVFGETLVNDAGEIMAEFKTLTLRAGGNCAFTSKFNDTYWQSLVQDLDCETQTSRPCIVYINGEYWGLYVLQEDYSDNYFEDTHGVNNKDVVLYKGDAETYDRGYKLDLGDLPDGVTDESYYFSDLLNFFDTHSDLKNQSDYDEFEKLVDVQSAMDYFAVEIWINNKWDWPGKNWSLWKTVNTDPENEYADGRWRFCFYDVEFGGVSGAGDATTNTIKEDNYKPAGLLDMDTTNPAVLIFAYLMTNENFRNEFNAKLAGLSETNFEYTKASQALDVFTKTYGPLYDQFFARYPGAGSTNDALNGGYASAKCIGDFLEKRAENIQNMISYVNVHYK